MLAELLGKLLKREFGSDLLGGISIITSVILGEYLAGSIIVLMLAGGEALESYALRSASSVLAALAKRVPSIAHLKNETSITDVALQDVAVGDTLVIYPHDICPVDGVVIEGHGVMDESYLTGEPFEITKTSGSTVISGAINGESALTIRTTKIAADSRYAKIMEARCVSPSRSARPCGGSATSSVRFTLRPPRRSPSSRGYLAASRCASLGSGDCDTVPAAHRDSHRHYRFDLLCARRAIIVKRGRRLDEAVVDLAVVDGARTKCAP